MPQIIEDLITQTIDCAYTVHLKLGSGFLEKVYENSLLIELRKRKLHAMQQVPILVNYEDQVVGEYFADIVVENQIIIELKAMKSLASAHSAQLINYLKAGTIGVGILVNFGAKPIEIKRLHG